MDASIRRELLLFWLSAGQGCLLHLLYDLLRGWRLALPPRRRALAVTDFFYWILCGCLLFLFVFRTNHGALRSFFLLGAGTGALLWNRLFSSGFVRIWSKMLQYPIFLVKIFRKRLLFCAERCKILGYQFIRWMKKGRKIRLVSKRGKRIGDEK